MEIESIPSFFIVGVQKSATSSIHSILSQDTRISLPYRKATHFFSTHFKKGISWYLKMFNNNTFNLRGEVDPSYSHYPEAFVNLNKCLKKSKFIIIFRKPIDRAYSHYLMSKKRNFEDLSFNKALLAEKNRLANDQNNFSFSNHSYLLRSEYCDVINRCKKIFPDSDYLFLKFDDFVNMDSRIEFIKGIYNFIGLEYPSDLNLSIHENQSSKIGNKFLGNNIYKNTFLRRFLKHVIPSSYYRFKIHNFIEHFNSDVLPDTIAKLDYRSLRKDIVKWNNDQSINLQKLTNINVDDWIIG